MLDSDAFEAVLSTPCDVCEAVAFGGFDAAFTSGTASCFPADAYDAVVFCPACTTTRPVVWEDATGFVWPLAVTEDANG